jgi:hypothetical protein
MDPEGLINTNLIGRLLLDAATTVPKIKKALGGIITPKAL